MFKSKGGGSKGKGKQEHLSVMNGVLADFVSRELNLISSAMISVTTVKCNFCINRSGR